MIINNFTTTHAVDDDIFPQIKWAEFDCLIGDKDNPVFEQKGVEAPAHWSQNAVNILASKYFRKSGVPVSTQPVHEPDMPDWLVASKPDYHYFNDMEESECYTGETSAHQVFSRMVGAWTYWGWKNKYFDTEGDALTYHREMYYMLAMQMGAPNSPQWFNTGLHWAYGIDGPAQGHFYVDPNTGGMKESDSAYERPQPHACFIQSVNDNLVKEGGIMDLWSREARLFKYGSGTGSNFSNIRGKGEPLSGGGTSSGLMSFLKIGDTAAGAIKSGGTTRRAAKMVILDDDHPDIMEFIEWKSREEQKVKALVEGSTGVDGLELSYDWNGEAYQTVSGQNSNNSVRLSDAFMQTLDLGEAWPLISRTDRTVHSLVDSEELFDKLAQAAWSCGDPGVQFHDTINEWNTCAESGEINASNPCGEYCFLDDTACNLASLNLVKFWDASDGGFDINTYNHAVRLWTITLDISVTMAQFPSKEIAQGTHDYRTLGLGYTNLGGLLMSMGLAYNSKEGQNICGALSSLMTAESYKTSAEIGSELGAFPKFKRNRTSFNNVIEKHTEASEDLWKSLFFSSECEASCILTAALDIWNQLKYKSNTLVYRNAQATCIAPTGTIGLVMDCATTGIEPCFSLIQHKQLAGGGSMQIVNPHIEEALQALGYDEEAIPNIRDFTVGVGDPDDVYALGNNWNVFLCASGLTPNEHLNMVAAAQPFISGSISKTINMPATATVKDVKDIYEDAWDVGVKSITIYRDGCKHSQPLTTNKQPVDQPTLSGRRELPSKRRGDTHRITIDGQVVFLRTGEYEDGTLGEIFLNVSREGSTLGGLLNGFAVAVSMGLQYGVPLDDYIDAFVLSKFEPAGMVQGSDDVKMCSSILDYVFRQLGVSYCGRNDLSHTKKEQQPVPVVETTNEYVGECRECGGRLQNTGTCATCVDCGTTTGCS